MFKIYITIRERRQFRTPLRIVISLLIWTYSIEELLKYLIISRRNKGSCNIIRVR